MKDTSKLVKKQIVDKTGKRTTVWVKPNEVEPTKKEKKAEEPSGKKRTYYRGVGNNYAKGKNEGFLWVASNESDAKDYAGRNEDGSYKIETYDLEIKNPLLFGYSRNVDVNKENIAQVFMKHMHEKIKSGEFSKQDWAKFSELLDEYRDAAPKGLVPFHSLLNMKSVSSKVASIVKYLGFDSIQIGEGDNATFGVLRDAKQTKSEKEPKFKSHSDVTKTKEFKEWFGDSKVVDEDGNPLVVYHGTTHDFSEFDSSKTGNEEGAFGAGNYFTTSETDVNENYAGFGVDLTLRIQNKAEQLQWDLESSDEDELVEVYGMSKKEAKELKESENYEAVAKKIAQKKLAGDSEGSVMPVYLKVEKPFDLLDEGHNIYLEWDRDHYIEMAEDEVDKDDYTDDEEYKEALEDKAREIYYDDYNPMEDGEGVKLIEALEKVLYNYNETGDFSAQDFRIKLQKEESFTNQEFVDYLKKELMYVTNDDDDLAIGQFISDVLQEAGYDGIIQDAYKDFGRGGDRAGSKAAMEMDYGTRHFIVFDSSQVKSAIGNSGKFDSNSGDITKSESYVKLRI